MSGGALTVSGQEATRTDLEQSREGAYVAPTSLFGCLWALTSWYGDKPFLGSRTRGPGSPYEYMTYTEVWTMASHLGAGAIKLGLVEPGEFLGVCCINRPEWMVAEFSTVQYNFVSVPIVVTVEEDVLAFMLNEAEIRCVVTSADLVPKFAAVLPRCPHLRGLIVLSGGAPVDPAVAATIRTHTMEEVLITGMDAFPGSYAGEKRTPNDLWSIIYTSGSTGMPKGAMMTDKRWTGFVTHGYLMPKPIRVISFAPLGHVSERQLLWIVAYYGGTVGFYGGDMKLIFDDMQTFNPTYLSAPPRIYNAIYTQYKEAVDAAVLRRGESERWRAELEELDPFRKVFGNAIQFLVTGSAPTTEAVKQFMRRCWCVPVYDGYGTTEAGGIATDNLISPDVDVKLIDVPELGYFTTDNPPRGEICVKTKHMIEGYFKNPQKTAESFVDGYFRTGDIGVRRGPVGVEIIDRVKNVFKLAQGEFVTPTKIESALEKSPLLDQICVVNAPSAEFAVAIVVPCLEACARLFSNDRCDSLGQLVQHHGPQLREALLTDFVHRGNRDGLQGYEVPARVVLSPFAFTPDNDLLTPSFKLKRAPIEKRFRAEVAAACEERVAGTVGAPASSLDERMRQLLGELLDRRIDGADATLAMQGADSLSAVKLVTRIREQFGADVPLAFVLSNPSVKALNELVAAGGAASSVPKLPALAQQDLSGDARRQLGPAQDAPVCALREAKVVLLTGATGFFGSFLLREILRALPELQTVVCLVRGPSDADSFARLVSVLQERSIEVDMARVRVLRGDLGEGLLGLESPKQFNALCRECDAVFHSAATVNWMLPYDTLRAANVLPCLDLVRFCTTVKRKPLFHVSTISCSPTRPTDSDSAGGLSAYAAEAARYEDYESFADDAWAALMGPYGQSKWVAEQVLRQCTPQLPLCVLRPANILADSTSGAANTTDFIHRYVATALRLGCFIEEEAVFNFTPVDWMCRATLAIALADSVLDGNTPFHLTNSAASPTYRRLGRVMRERMGYKDVALVPYAEFRARLLAHPPGLPLYGLLPMFGTSPQWLYSHKSDCTNTQRVVPDACPATTDDALCVWIRWMQSSKFIAKPQ